MPCLPRPGDLHLDTLAHTCMDRLLLNEQTLPLACAGNVQPCACALSPDNFP